MKSITKLALCLALVAPALSAHAETYQAGSTFKIFTLSSADDAGDDEDDLSYDCSGLTL